VTDKGEKGIVRMSEKSGGEEVIVYELIGTPPSFRGASHVTLAFPVPAKANTFSGCVGGPRGVIPEEAALSAPSPNSLVAVTENVYSKPFVSPVTTAELSESLTLVKCNTGSDKEKEYAVYAVIGDSPSYIDAIHDTVVCPSCPSIADIPEGGSGYVIAFMGADGVLGGEVPISFSAVTTNV
jgi:hypothetical protein